MAHASFRCMCGRLHALPRERVIEHAGARHWRCTYCQRRFVLVFEPPGTFTPIYVDPTARASETLDTGTDAALPRVDSPLPPPAIDFKCRCGTSITAHSWMYGGTVVCPGCRTTILVALRYNPKRAWHVIVPEYPPTDSTTRMKAVKPAGPPSAAPRPRIS